MLHVLVCGNKRQTRCNRSFFYCKTYCLLNMFRGTIMPIIRSSRVIQMAAACGTWLFGLQVVGLVSRAPDDGHNGAQNMLSKQ